jgi:CheY-like chemotaxis protein
VLVADDSPTIQKKAVGILKGEGFEVETVSNGVAAIKRLAVLHPVVILADVSMPGRDGYEVCDFVKKSTELCRVPVLLVASDMEPYDEARGSHVRADGIIKKPFDPQELISQVVKLADAFDAEAPTMAMPAVAPPPVPEPTPEFVVTSDNPEETLGAGAPPPDFSSVSEGVAFAEPAGEQAPVYSTEPAPAYSAESAPAYSEESAPAAIEEPYGAPQAEAEFASGPAAAAESVDTIPAAEPESAPAAETPLVLEEPPAPDSIAPPPPPTEQAPSFVEGSEAGALEPVFVEEQAAPAAEAPRAVEEVRTMIFRAPLQIAEPVWRDETVPSPPTPEPVASTAVEPQLEPEAPAAPLEGSVEEPPEPRHLAPPVAATSLDSFSLDDATAGQVRFASQAVEVESEEAAHAAHAEESPAADTVPLESSTDAASTETAPQEPAPEVVSTETAPPEAAPEAAQPEPPAEGTAPAPAYDWGLIYTVVHKVVVRMSPPALPMEAVEEMARRLADEIATEISTESPPPQT